MATAGYSGTPLAGKLGLKPGGTLVLLNAIDGIEDQLAPMPAATVIRRGDTASLVGVVVSAPGLAADPLGLRFALADRLPAYMIPGRLVVAEQLPLNSNGVAMR